MGRNLEHTSERHQRGFKVPMEMGPLTGQDAVAGGELVHPPGPAAGQHRFGRSRETGAPLAVTAEGGARFGTVAGAQVAPPAQPLHLPPLGTAVLLWRGK